MVTVPILHCCKFEEKKFVSLLLDLSSEGFLGV